MKKYKHIIKKEEFNNVKSIIENECNIIFKDFVENFNQEKEFSMDLKAFYSQRIFLLGVDPLSFEILKTLKFNINDDLSVSLLDFKNTVRCLNRLKYERKFRYKVFRSIEMIDYFFEGIKNESQDNKFKRFRNQDETISVINVEFNHNSADLIGKKASYNILFIKSYKDAITDMCKIFYYRFILSLINNNIEIDFKNKKIDSKFNAKQWGIFGLLMKNYIYEESITNESLSKILCSISGLSSTQFEKKHLSPISITKSKLSKIEKDNIIRILDLMKDELQ